MTRREYNETQRKERAQVVAYLRRVAGLDAWKSKHCPDDPGLADYYKHSSWRLKDMAGSIEARAHKSRRRPPQATGVSNEAKEK